MRLLLASLMKVRRHADYRQPIGIIADMLPSTLLSALIHAPRRSDQTRIEGARTADNSMSARRKSYPANQRASDSSRSDYNLLHHHRDALTAADAHGDKAIAAAGALQLIDRLDGEDRAGRANGMAERNAVEPLGLVLVGSKAQFACHAHSLRGEGFVRSDDIVILIEVSPACSSAMALPSLVRPSRWLTPAWPQR